MARERKNWIKGDCSVYKRKTKRKKKDRVVERKEELLVVEEEACLGTCSMLWVLCVPWFLFYSLSFSLFSNSLFLRFAFLLFFTFFHALFFFPFLFQCFCSPFFLAIGTREAHLETSKGPLAPRSLSRFFFRPFFLRVSTTRRVRAGGFTIAYTRVWRSRLAIFFSWKGRRKREKKREKEGDPLFARVEVNRYDACERRTGLSCAFPDHDTYIYVHIRMCEYRYTYTIIRETSQAQQTSALYPYT